MRRPLWMEKLGYRLQEWNYQRKRPVWMQKMGLALERVNLKKWLIYLTGFAIFTAGIPFLTHSQLGLSPWDSGLMGLNYLTKLPVTIWSNVLAIVALILAGLMLKKFPNVFTIISSFLCGFGIDFWVWLIGDKITLSPIPSYIIGTLINAFGIAVYLMADALPTSVDYAMLTFCKHFKLKVMWGRIVTDGIGLVICLACGGWQHKLIGVGTIISFFLMGPLMQFFMNILAKFRLFAVNPASGEEEKESAPKEQKRRFSRKSKQTT